MPLLTTGELTDLIEHVARSAGAGVAAARTLADATVQAERVGNRAVGVGHLFDYLDGYRTGRIVADVSPDVRRVSPAIIDIDAREGLAQDALHAARAELVAATREQGITALWIRNSYTCGELGYYPRAVAGDGLISIAAANSPALMSLGGSPNRILGTNPLAFGFPGSDGPVVIDQASSATAYVNIRRAADADEQIPAGWALNCLGEPTTNPAEALEGTLLPFGSHRGGNIALLIEILATLSGASFSIDAAPFDRGGESPRIGVFLLCIDPTRFGGAAERLTRQLSTLQEEHGVRLPALDVKHLPDAVEIDDALLQRLTLAAS